MDAIHPGYGFLAENIAFANGSRSWDDLHRPRPGARVPSVTSFHSGCEGSRCTVIPGSDGAVDDVEEAAVVAKHLPPHHARAAFGAAVGHARWRPGWPEEGVRADSAEAQAAFGNGAVFMERRPHRTHRGTVR